MWNDLIRRGVDDESKGLGLAIFSPKLPDYEIDVKRVMSEIRGMKKISARESGLRRLYHECFGQEPDRFIILRADGSNREIFRLEGPDNAIGVFGPDRSENRAFIGYARSLAKAGLPVPEIYGVSGDESIYLQEDLGSTTLFELLGSSREESRERMPEGAAEIYRKVIALLPRLQIDGGNAVDFGLAIPRPLFDRRCIMWDLHYFKYLFLMLVDVPFDENRLEDDLERLADAILEEEPVHFMARDFQSRNIMVRSDADGNRSPWFIDFQGGRRGPLGYDVASLLYDAKADLPRSFRTELLESYIAEASESIELDPTLFRHRFPLFILVRALQAMGAYGYRGLYQGKEHFVASIPFAVRNVRRLLSDDFPIALPELSAVFERVAEVYGEEVAAPTGWQESDGRLAVTIRSFGFPRGSYPVDTGGHGGGHVFDCRVLENPGRLAEFREQSGLDTGVVAFLEARDEVQRFYELARSITTASVERYLERGFDSLSIGFGCTGGQHRSVYMAERLGAELEVRYGERLLVEVEHRERYAWDPNA